MTKFRKLLFSAVSISLFLVFSTSSTMAAPYTSSFASAGRVGGSYNIDNSGIDYGYSSSAYASYLYSTLGNEYAYANSEVNAEYGVLRVNAGVEVYDTYGTYSAYGSAYFSDGITVTSDYLAVGTPVTLNLSYTSDGAFIIGSGSYYTGNESSGISALDSYNNTLGSDTQGWGVSVREPWLAGTWEYGDPSFETTVGAYFTLFAYLNVNVEAASYYYWIPGFVDTTIVGAFGDTAHYYLDSQTAGVSFTSDSGHDYTTPAATPNPVPEPGTFLLLGSGMAGLALFRKRMGR